ncbi:AAA family ATPase [Streptomyces sp. NPDC005283]|uniref:AAA family ATPase n=1 Tax=Streptomyces sp. NPDC005283 TaxID=3156871 RepID=UPI00345340C6
MIRLRELQMRVVTDGPICGADIPFKDGLNVVRADNSSGKSTCMQAIIYALGLEGMFSARRDIPLPHAMTDSIEVQGREFDVVESWVALELENASGQVITVRRAVKSSLKDTTLIEKFEGARLSQNIEMTQGEDFFVRRGGAAVRDRGFHHFLARFLGWSLPQVARMDGSEGPLYLECLFPYFFVEQKHGWSGVQARIPTHFMIRDVSRRVAEFILELDEYQAVLKRQRLEAAASIMDSEWKQTVDRVAGAVKSQSVVLRGFPQRPVGDRQDVKASSLIASADGWVSLDDELERLQGRAAEIEQFDVPSIEESASQLDGELRAQQEKLAISNSLAASALAELEDSLSRRDDLESRVEALEEDLQRHKDAALLRRLGARHAEVISGDSFCPTCQQALPDGFEITETPMTPDESVLYIEQEVRTFRAMKADLDRLIVTQEAKLDRLRSESSDLRRSIRTIKDTLTSPSSMPSVADVAEKIRIQDRISSLAAIQDEIFHTVEELRARAQTWQANRAALKELTKRRQSPLDREKIDYLEATLVAQLASYHFVSLEPGEIKISEDTYRPTHEGFDLGFDLSASDMIRVIWAYLFAFLETSIRFDTNHARLLIFDEPRQQETKRPSFAALLERAVKAGESGAQIIFATSEVERELQSMLRGQRHHMFSIPPERKLLRPLDS